MVSVTTLCNFNKVVFVYFGKIERSGFESWPGTVLCFWARHFTLTVRLSTQLYKCMGADDLNAGGNPAMD